MQGSVDGVKRSLGSAKVSIAHNYGVGYLAVMVDGPAARRPAHELDPPSFGLTGVVLTLGRLIAPQRDARWPPAVEAKHRRATVANRFRQGNIYCHVARPRARGRLDKAPGVGEGRRSTARGGFL